MKLDSVVLLGVLAYIGNLFKSTIVNWIRYFLKIFSSSISVEKSYRTSYAYEAIMKYIMNIEDPIVNNNIAYSPNVFSGSRSDKEEVRIEISPGVYFIKIDILNFIKFNISKLIKQNDTATAYTVDVVFIGLKHKKHMKELKDIIDANYDKINKLCVSTFGIDNIGYETELREKSMDTLFIKDKDFILDKINNWRKMKSIYERNGIVYKFGILLHGEPGTGKTSFAIALANYLKFDLVVFNNINSSGRNSFNNCVVLIEDLDCILQDSIAKAKAHRTDNAKYIEKNVSSDDKLHTLLQMLDGATSSSDTIFILTTNHKEEIDSRIYRSGRINLEIELGKINKELARKMCDSFEAPYSILVDEPEYINPSYLQDKILQSINPFEYVSIEDKAI